MKHRSVRLKPLQYKVRMDWWVLLAVIVFVGMIVVMIPLLFFISATPSVASVVSAIILIGFAAYYIDAYFYRVYILGSSELIIAGHIVTFRFPYRGMLTVAPGTFLDLFTRTSLSGKKRHKRFALSRKNVVISFSKEHHHWTSISLSPNDPESFIRAIVERVEHERNARASDTQLSE